MVLKKRNHIKSLLSSISLSLSIIFLLSVSIHNHVYPTKGSTSSGTSISNIEYDNYNVVLICSACSLGGKHKFIFSFTTYQTPKINQIFREIFQNENLFNSYHSDKSSRSPPLAI